MERGADGRIAGRGGGTFFPRRSVRDASRGRRASRRPPIGLRPPAPSPALLLLSFSFLLFPAARQACFGQLTVIDSPEPVRVAPAPVTAGRGLKMARLDLEYGCPSISFNVGTARRYGPYPLKDGSPVGSGEPPYRLADVRPDGLFSLRAPDGGLLGPFSARHGAVFRLGGAALTVIRPRPDLAVTLPSGGLARQKPKIGITPVNETLPRALARLKATCVAALNRLNLDTAPVRIEGLPRIHNRNTGRSYANTFAVSGRDRENAERQAEFNAIAALTSLFDKRFHIGPYAVTDGRTYRFRMPPGDYALCAMQKISGKRASSFAPSRTAVWWTFFHFDGERPCSVTLTDDNAADWRGLFLLDETAR